nr:RNA-directed DNA polymerase, eukaryota, reverse transcriptase zinc-binding domain protein [Tanacetum cinerariifolium]
MWDCGIDKSLRPDGFTFGFYRRYWDIIKKDVADAVSFFFISDGPFILDELIQWCHAKKKETMIFKVDFEKAYDSVRWDYLDDVLNKFGFGSKWRNWIHNCLNSSKGSILVNGSLFKGVLVSTSLHLFYLFYADDVIFMGQWSVSNINTLVQALDCFYKASGLWMNLQKSKLMGISVEDEIVSRAASKMGCCTLTTPFLYHGVKVGGSMSRIKAWDEIEAKLNSRLSKWKLKTLSSGGEKDVVVQVVPSVGVKRQRRVRGFKYFRFKWSSFVQMDVAFFNDKDALWSRFIRVVHGNSGGIETHSIYALESRDGEMKQFRALSIVIEGVLLHDMVDRWKWILEGSGEFSVASARKFIDNSRLTGSLKKTRWIKMVPIKVNILAWKVQFDLLPTHLNLSRR